MQNPNVESTQDLQTPSNPLANYQFTSDELRVLKECNTESFFQRSLPLGTLLGLSTYYGIRANYFKGSPRWGPTPKVMLAVTVGYFIGKFSYQSRCAEKLMQLPNSRLAELLRQRKRTTGLQESLDTPFAAGVSLPPLASINPGEVYSDVGMGNLDLDADRPQSVGLDDSRRPNLDTPVDFTDEPLEPIQKAPAANYEDLRRKNREEYQKSRGQNFRGVAEQSVVLKPSSSQPEDDSVAGYRKNKYGDVWG